MIHKINLKKFILFFLVIFFLLEILLRVFAPLYFTGSIEAYEYDDLLGVKVKKNLNLVKITDVRQEYITNNIGTFNFEDDFSVYDKIVFAAGDSYTQGTGVSPSSSYPFNLYINLNTSKKKTKKTYGVLNLGLAAYGFDQSFLTIKKYFNDIKPDYIIYLGVGNDERDDFLFKSGHRHNHLVSGSPKFFGLGNKIGYFTNNIEILKRIKLIISKRKVSASYKINNSNESSFNFNKYIALKEFSELNNIKLLISWYQCHKSEINNYNKLKIWSEKNNIDFVDWCADFKKIKSLNPNLPFANNHSSGHHRPWLYKIIAKNISDKIIHDEE